MHDNKYSYLTNQFLEITFLFVQNFDNSEILNQLVKRNSRIEDLLKDTIFAFLKI